MKLLVTKSSAKRGCFSLVERLAVMKFKDKFAIFSLLVSKNKVVLKIFIQS
jgi:hypothetical protein